LFDGSLQGIAFNERAAFGFQGHPEASPGPHDLLPLFERFMADMDAYKRDATGMAKAAQ
jgi:carbamoyl-phosphate synthase small subunit